MPTQTSAANLSEPVYFDGPEHTRSYQPSLPRVLVIDETEAFGTELQARLGNVLIRTAPSPDDTEGIGVDVIVVAGPYPVRQLAEIRVHPELATLPVILIAPNRPLGDSLLPDPYTVPVTAAPDTVGRTAALLERLVRWRAARRIA
jgi:hypothetical protein